MTKFIVSILLLSVLGSSNSQAHQLDILPSSYDKYGINVVLEKLSENKVMVKVRLRKNTEIGNLVVAYLIFSSKSSELVKVPIYFIKFDKNQFFNYEFSASSEILNQLAIDLLYSDSENPNGSWLSIHGFEELKGS